MPTSRLIASMAVTLGMTLAGAAGARAQEPTTREEQIQVARREKLAMLWPEHENPMVVRANRLLDRGLFEGIEGGQGSNGWQLILSGTRPNQGQTFGIGYRRSDLFRDALSVRATARGTIPGGFLVDLEAGLNRFRRSKDTFADLYLKYERSPRMEFYGLGRDSLVENRTRYLLNTATADFRAGYRITRNLNIGVDLVGGTVHTGPSGDGDVPSIETKFDATTAPGLFDDTTFLAWGGFAGFDARDLPRGPKRGGFYGVSFNRYLDQTGGRYSHRQILFEGQQFLPYFNETRVIALFLKARFAYAGREDRVVPFYLLPKLGGNFELRGFGPYRFHDNNALTASIEHRWYAFPGLEMAVFVDAGKTVSEKGQLHLSGLNYSGGIGFRGRLRGAVILRIDVAASREGLRVIWSISDISRRRF